MSNVKDGGSERKIYNFEWISLQTLANVILICCVKKGSGAHLPRTLHCYLCKQALSPIFIPESRNKQMFHCHTVCSKTEQLNSYSQCNIFRKTQLIVQPPYQRSFLPRHNVCVYVKLYPYKYWCFTGLYPSPTVT